MRGSRESGLSKHDESPRTFALINPIIGDASAKQRIFRGSSPVEAAEAFWIQFAHGETPLIKNIPQMAFTMIDNTDRSVHHFAVKESIRPSGVTFEVRELDDVMTPSQESQFISAMETKREDLARAFDAARDAGSDEESSVQSGGYGYRRGFRRKKRWLDIFPGTEDPRVRAYKERKQQLRRERTLRKLAAIRRVDLDDDDSDSSTSSDDDNDNDDDGPLGVTSDEFYGAFGKIYPASDSILVDPQSGIPYFTYSPVYQNVMDSTYIPVLRAPEAPYTEIYYSVRFG